MGASKEPSFMKLLSSRCENSGLLRMFPIDYSKVEVCNFISFEITRNLEWSPVNVF